MIDGFEPELGEGVDDVGTDGSGEGGEGGEREGAKNVGREDGGPETGGLPEVFLFREDEGYGVEGVLGKELRAAEDDDDKAERVEHFGDELNRSGGLGSSGGEHGEGDGVAEGGEAHEDATGEGGDGEGDAGAAEFLAGVVGDLLVDVLGAGPLEVFLGLNGGCGRSGRIRAVEAKAHGG